MSEPMTRPIPAPAVAILTDRKAAVVVSLTQKRGKRPAISLPDFSRINALLREMSIKSQFILITHNKKTMELNDTLYGVTMEEPGVSKMVSIQMQ